jgi:hypothetical protein
VPWTENDVRWVAARLLPDLHDIYQDAARKGHAIRQLEAVRNEITAFYERSIALDRLTDKFKRAAGVVERVSSSIEADVDGILAREDQLTQKSKRVSSKHHGRLDSRSKNLDQLDAALNLLDNGDPDPLEGSGDGSKDGSGEKQPEEPASIKPVSLFAAPADSLLASQAGIDLIVTEEDGNQLYYTHHYQHFEWPEGASGPTVGIGYDCGYSKPGQIRQDWHGIISDASIEILVKAAGLTGQKAHAFVQQYGNSVTINWDQAMAEFMQRELPKWEALNRQALPNYDTLPADCAGALDSLSYNRGVIGYSADGPRYAEMRAIKDHMTNKQFKLIPREILGMRRLWPVGGDLWRRREHEAALFSQGIDPLK